MTCTSCGTTLPQDVHFCTHCGAPAPVQPQPAAPYASLYAALGYNRVSRHLQVAGILWLVYAGLRFFTALAGLLFLHGFLSGRAHEHWSGWGAGWSPFGNSLGLALLPVAIVSVIIGLGLNLLTAYALLTRQPWARIFAIIFSIFALIHFPFGTLLGIYTLWVMAPSASGIEYEALSHATSH